MKWEKRAPRGDFEEVLEMMRQFLRRSKRTLVGTVNYVCALAAIRAFEEVGASDKITVASQNCIPEIRTELRRSSTPLVGSVAYFPERYGNEIIPLALGILRQKLLASTVFVKHQSVTQRNVDLIYPLDERSGSTRGLSSQSGKSLRSVA
jgi:ribose transport system substrate-binding protein